MFACVLKFVRWCWTSGVEWVYQSLITGNGCLLGLIKVAQKKPYSSIRRDQVKLKQATKTLEIIVEQLLRTDWLKKVSYKVIDQIKWCQKAVGSVEKRKRRSRLEWEGKAKSYHSINICYWTFTKASVWYVLGMSGRKLRWNKGAVEAFIDKTYCSIHAMTTRVLLNTCNEWLIINLLILEDATFEWGWDSSSSRNEPDSDSCILSDCSTKWSDRAERGWE